MLTLTVSEHQKLWLYIVSHQLRGLQRLVIELDMSLQQIEVLMAAYAYQADKEVLIEGVYQKARFTVAWLVRILGQNHLVGHSVEVLIRYLAWWSLALWSSLKVHSIRRFDRRRQQEVAITFHGSIKGQDKGLITMQDKMIKELWMWKKWATLYISLLHQVTGGTIKEVVFKINMKLLEIILLGLKGHLIKL